MHVCTHVHRHVYRHAHTDTHTSTYMSVHMSTHKSIHMSLHMFIRMRKALGRLSACRTANCQTSFCILSCVHVCVCVDVCVCVLASMRRSCMHICGQTTGCTYDPCATRTCISQKCTRHTYKLTRMYMHTCAYGRKLSYGGVRSKAARHVDPQ